MIEQHTLGPWTHEGQGDITGIENDPANGWVGKVDVAHVYLRMAPGRTEANARLIAAAPDLLEALKECVEDSEQAVGEYVEKYGETYRPQRLQAMRDTVTKARAAIAKAEGGAA